MTGPTDHALPTPANENFDPFRHADTALKSYIGGEGDC